MRDPKRIRRITQLIEKIWEEHPDFRLCQLIGNCFGDPIDLYYFEDDVIEKRLKEYYYGEYYRGPKNDQNPGQEPTRS